MIFVEAACLFFLENSNPTAEELKQIAKIKAMGYQVGVRNGASWINHVYEYCDCVAGKVPQVFEGTPTVEEHYDIFKIEFEEPENEIKQDLQDKQPVQPVEIKEPVQDLIPVQPENPQQGQISEQTENQKKQSKKDAKTTTTWNSAK